ncbi:uncharacterized protein LOC119666840 [Teleopsis dalmanni]|uniref:uncharacterized protein LOC119666840 n=1 Tax=Teleopsis dalmanni TaxID=139649 RepID=UPI0018CF6BE6|nr:uncharacterized protein LOC119666840 [Teleopsis dalmanni]
MGKCVSKHPSLLTIAISEKDLATANQIWSKFAESTEYIALKDEHGNQLCEYYYVSKKVGCGHNEQEQYEQASQQNQQQQEEWQQQSQILQTSKKNKSSQLTTTEIYNVAANAFNSKMVDDCELIEQRQRYAAPLQTANHVVDVNNTNHSSTNRLNAEQHGLPLLRLLQTQKQKHQQHEQHHQHHQHQQHQQHLEHKEQQKHQTQLQQQQQQQHELQVQQINAKSKTLEIVAVADAESNANIQHSNVVGVKNDKNSKNRNKQKFHNFKYSTIFGKSNVRDAKVLDWLTYDYEYGYVDVNSPQPHVEQVNCVFIYEDNEEGQTESKKSKKQGAGSIETKGTAMSFGFRKKLNTTPKKLKKLIEGDSKKKHDKCNNISDDDVGRTTGAVIDTEIIVTTENIHEDDNGNSDTMPKVYFEKMGAAAAGGKSAQKFSTNQGVPEQSQTANRPGAGNRFGYRGCNVARPASTGITGRYRSDSHENVENNNCTVTEGGQQKPLVSNLKRRSKSAHAGRALTSNQSEEQEEGSADAAPKITQPKTLTFNLNQNSTIEYQRQQFFQQPTHSANGRAGYMSTAQYQQHQPRVINTGMHTNVILRPTPRAPPATYSKFTLHTVSLPKPEFPVAISVSATTPTTPGSVFSPSPVTATALGSAGARAKDAIVYRVTHPLTAVQTQQHMDQKTAKQMANTTRRGFTGSREISADSGIASMDMALDSSTSSAGGNGGGRHSSPKRSRSRPRNLQMVMNGRHKFEVRDLDDPLSSESSSIVEPLALPKLPAENQTVPLPLSGLIRSNTVLSRESYERKNVSGQRVELEKPKSTSRAIRHEIQRNPSEESESVDEEKLYLDRSASEKSAKLFKDINTCSSKTSSPGSSIMSSWCNAGESLAVKDCSSLSISSSEDSNKVQERLDERKQKAEAELQLELNDDDISMLNTEMQISTISSLTETVPNAAQMLNNSKEENLEDQTMLDDLPKTESTEHILNLNERPKSLYDALNESKFAELALAGSAFLLDDETSPTDSLVSSTESEDAVCKQKKHKINEELQEKDIDEISPEFEVGSPISPGTPTHASHSLSLSDCGNLIDDEIADQPALLFNSEHQDGGDSLASRKEKTDTPTLMETGSMRSLKSQSKARTALQQAIELSLRTPLSLRKAVMERAESLDTLSPCESICSDDLMMDFDMNSSLDSIDRSASIRSRSGSDLNKIGESELFPELSRKSSDVMKELNTILKVHNNKNKEKDSIINYLAYKFQEHASALSLHSRHNLHDSVLVDAFVSTCNVPLNCLCHGTSNVVGICCRLRWLLLVNQITGQTPKTALPAAVRALLKSERSWTS